MIHFELIIRCEVKSVVHFTRLIGGLFFLFFAYGHAVAPKLFIEKTILSLLSCLCTFVRNKLAIFKWVCFWTLLCSIDLYVYTFCFCSCIVSLKTWQCCSSNFILFLLNCVTWSSLFAFHINFRFSFSIATQNSWDFYWNYVKLIYQFGEIALCWGLKSIIMPWALLLSV